jgi:hypothetical protein
MSESININESPKHLMVLDSISRGIEDAGKMSKVMKIDKAEVEIILNDLTFQRLIIVEQKKGLFAKKMQAPHNRYGTQASLFKKAGIGRQGKGA